jgi:hypothetical protein
MDENLPDGVMRERYVSKSVTLENCQAIRFYFDPPIGSVEHSVIVWRNRPAKMKPLETVKRLRDLRPGDKVIVNGKTETMIAVEIYR